MKKIKFTSTRFLLLTVLILTACATKPNSAVYDDGTGDNLNVSFNIISQGAFSNISLANELVIRNNKDWLRLLKIHATTPFSKKLKIDFSDQIVIAIFAGQQPSGGYSVGVSNIKRVNDNLFVTVTFHEPGKNEAISLALTQPYIMFATNKVDGKVIFLTPPRNKKNI